ncbi:MAG: Bacterial membrane protein YfhO [Microgenomates bacterium OLB23]|nr:MAG: Bacterial membrane protein YfhO [Microgenomates bacterium OLB23]
MGFFYPWNHIVWPTQELTNAALHHKNYLISDSVGVILPVKLYVMDAIKQGILPLWNPYILNGTSLLGNTQAAVLYPFNLLYMIMPYAWAYTLYVLAQIVLSLLFMYGFLRKIGMRIIVSIFGAVSFAFSAYIIVWLTLGTLAHAYMWIPFVLWCFEHYTHSKNKAYFVGIVAGLTLSLLAGHMQTAVFAYLAFFIWVAATSIQKTLRANIVIFFSAVLLSIGISAVALIPAYETYTQSVRGSFVKEDFFAAESLNADSFIQALAPDFFGNPVTRKLVGKN